MRQVTTGTVVHNVAFGALTPQVGAILPDMPGSGGGEFVVLDADESTGKNTAFNRDSNTGELLKKIEFLTHYRPIALVVVSGGNGGGSPNDTAVAVLGIHRDTGEVRVQVRTVATGTVTQNMALSGSIPLALAILGTHRTTGALQVQIHDAAADGFTKSIAIP